MFTIPLAFFKISSTGESGDTTENTSPSKQWTLKYVYGSADVSRGTYNLRGNLSNPIGHNYWIYGKWGNTGVDISTDARILLITGTQESRIIVIPDTYDNITNFSLNNFNDSNIYTAADQFSCGGSNTSYSCLTPHNYVLTFRYDQRQMYYNSNFDPTNANGYFPSGSLTSLGSITGTYNVVGGSVYKLGNFTRLDNNNVVWYIGEYNTFKIKKFPITTNSSNVPTGITNSPQESVSLDHDPRDFDINKDGTILILCDGKIFYQYTLAVGHDLTSINPVAIRQIAYNSIFYGITAPAHDNTSQRLMGFKYITDETGEYIIGITDQTAGYNNNIYLVSSSIQTLPSESSIFYARATGGNRNLYGTMGLSTAYYYFKSITFKDTGKLSSGGGDKFYVLDGYANSYTPTIIEYSLANPWDLTSSAYLVSTKTIPSPGANTPYLDMTWNYSGTKCWVYFYTSAAREYTFSTPWDVSTMTYSSTLAVIGIADYVEDGINKYLFSIYSNSGANFELRRYDITSSFSSTNYTNSGNLHKLIDVLGANNSSGRLRFNHNGLYFYMFQIDDTPYSQTDPAGYKIFVFKLETAFDPTSTVTFLGAVDVPQEQGSVGGDGFYIRRFDAKKLYINQRGNESTTYMHPPTILEYDLDNSLAVIPDHEIIIKYEGNRWITTHDSYIGTNTGYNYTEWNQSPAVNNSIVTLELPNKKIGKAFLNINSHSYYVLSSPSYTTNSCSMWFRLPSDTTSFSNFVSSGSSRYMLLQVGNNPTLAVQFNSSGYLDLVYHTYSTDETIIISGSTALNSDTWNNVVVTRHNTIFYLYVNGTLEGSSDFTTTAINESGNKNIYGLRKVGFTQSSNLIVYNICVYKNTLSSDEVSAIFNEFANVDKGPVVYISYEVPDTIDIYNGSRDYTSTSLNTYRTTSVYKVGNSSGDYTGNRHTLIPASASTNSMTSFTIMGWVYPTALSGIDVLFQSSYYNTSLGNGFRVYFNNNNTLQTELYYSDTTTTSYSTSMTFSTNKWYHIASVITPNSVSHYVDGALVSGSGNITSFSWSSGQGFYVGGDPNHTNQFDRYIDQFKLFDYALTTAQVYSQYSLNVSYSENYTPGIIYVPGFRKKSENTSTIYYRGGYSATPSAQLDLYTDENKTILLRSITSSNTEPYEFAASNFTLTVNFDIGDVLYYTLTDFNGDTVEGAFKSEIILENPDMGSNTILESNYSNIYGWNSNTDVTASASSGNNAAFRVFSKNNNYWNPSSSTNQWVQLLYKYQVSVRSYALTMFNTSSYLLKKWKLQGSNDNENWTDLETEHDITSATSVYSVHPVNPNGLYYIAYRLYITLGTTSCIVKELKLYTADMTPPDLVQKPAFWKNGSNIYFRGGYTNKPKCTIEFYADESHTTLLKSCTSSISSPFEISESNFDPSTSGFEVGNTVYYKITDWYGVLETTGSFVAELMMENPDFTGLTSVNSTYDSVYGWASQNGWLTSSSSNNGISWKIFDHSANSNWYALRNSVSNEWVSIQYQYPIEVRYYVLRNYSATSYMLKKWKLQGSNDNENWTDLETEHDITSATSEYSIHNVNSENQRYLLYRIYVTLGTTVVLFNELTLYTADTLPLELVQKPAFWKNGSNIYFRGGYTNKPSCTVEFYADESHTTLLKSRTSSISSPFEISASNFPLPSGGIWNVGSTVYYKITDWNGVLETTGSFVTELMMENPDFTGLTTVDTNYQTVYGWASQNDWLIDQSAVKSTSVYGWKAFDKNTVTFWTSDIHTNQWVSIQYPYPVEARYYILQMYNTSIYMLKQWKLQGSNDNENWTDLETEHNVTSVVSVYSINNVNTSNERYMLYRLYVTLGTGGVLVPELSLFTADTLPLELVQKPAFWKNGSNIHFRGGYLNKPACTINLYADESHTTLLKSRTSNGTYPFEISASDFPLPSGGIWNVGSTVYYKITDWNGVLETTGSFVADLMFENPDFTSATAVHSDYNSIYGWASNGDWRVQESSYGNGSYRADEAFDKNTGTFWQSGTNTNAWIYITYPYPVAATYYVVQMYHTNYLLKEWKLQGSNDLENWTDLETANTLSVSNFTYFINNVNSDENTYMAYRLYVTDGNNGIFVKELKIYTKDSESVELLTNPGFWKSGSTVYFRAGFANKPSSVLSMYSDSAKTTLLKTITSTSSEYFEFSASSFTSSSFTVGDTIYYTLSDSYGVHTTNGSFVSETILENPDFTGLTAVNSDYNSVYGWSTNSGWSAIESAYGNGSNYRADKAFNKGNTGWFSSSGNSTEWVSITYPSAVILKGYLLEVESNTSHYPTTWVMQGSNDSTTWTNVESVHNVSNLFLKHNVFAVNNTDAYTSYRLYVTGMTNSQIIIEELRLYTKLSS